MRAQTGLVGGKVSFTLEGKPATGRVVGTDWVPNHESQHKASRSQKLLCMVLYDSRYPGGNWHAFHELTFRPQDR